MYKKKTIIRTNFFGKNSKSIKSSYSDYIINNLKNKKITRVPTNIYFSPIHMVFLSKFLKKIITKKIYGIYNLGSSSALSKYEFGKKIAQIKKLPTKYLIPYLSKIKIHQRPNGTIMNIKKIENKLKIKMPKIDRSLVILK